VTAGPQLPPSREVLLPGRGRARVYDAGTPEGPDRGTLLLLHGWTSTAALNWYRCFPQLSRTHRVVALDQRGHGRGVRSRARFTLEDCADDAATLVGELGLGSVIVVGYSMGGPVAQLMWRRHRAIVDGLVLCATAARFTRRAQVDGALWRAGMGASMALSLLPSRLRRSGMSLATRNWSADSPWAADEWRLHEPAALIQAGLALSRFDSTSWIGEVDVPTAIVVTERDTTVPPSAQRVLADGIPGAAAFPVEGDHRVVVDHPKAFNPVLLSACETVAERRRSERSTAL
jgi:3-oxoadipate enol-lactonase